MPLLNMNFKTIICLTLLAGTLGLGTGCTTKTETDLMQDTAKYSIKDTEKFATLDKATGDAVECTGLRERLRPDGCMEVVANIKNLSAKPLSLQFNCVFKDAKGFSVGDETPFQKVTIGGDATEVVRFTAANPTTKRYTIRVRQAR